MPVMPTWQNFVQPITDANERLSRAWGQVSHLNAVANTPELRETYNANLPLVTQYYAELAQDPVLFEKFKQLRNSQEFESLSQARKKIIENDLRDFRLGGAELPLRRKSGFCKFRKSCRRWVPDSMITCWIPLIILYCMYRTRMSFPAFPTMRCKRRGKSRKKIMLQVGNLRCTPHHTCPSCSMPTTGHCAKQCIELILLAPARSDHRLRKRQRCRSG